GFDEVGGLAQHLAGELGALDDLETETRQFAARLALAAFQASTKVTGGELVAELVERFRQVEHVGLLRWGDLGAGEVGEVVQYQLRDEFGRHRVTTEERLDEVP